MKYSYPFSCRQYYGLFENKITKKPRKKLIENALLDIFKQQKQKANNFNDYIQGDKF